MLLYCLEIWLRNCFKINFDACLELFNRIKAKPRLRWHSEEDTHRINMIYGNISIYKSKLLLWHCQPRRNFPLYINHSVSRNSIWFLRFFNRSKLAQFHLVHLGTRLMNGLTTFEYFYTHIVFYTQCATYESVLVLVCLFIREPSAESYSDPHSFA